MKTILFILLTLITLGTSAKEYHVAIKGSDKNDGSLNKPFRTIEHAAQIAQAGDIIIVHAGTYREWVNPKNGGESDTKRIVYRAARGEKVNIKGSEVIKGWEKEKNGIWKVVIPNGFFGNYNPFKDYVFGDWCDNFDKVHTCDIFLNGKTLYEKNKIDDVNIFITKNTIDKDSAAYTWYCKSDSLNTTVWANFQQFNPNKELVEASIRRTCFYPDKPGINYITVSGFNISQAATQWAAPTAEQIGMISTHWNKGWIIENNIIHDSKCSGITLGKDRSTGQNVWSANPSYDGAIHYIEVIFRALRNGWSKGGIGSHIVRNNEIFNCEQTGICGSMGAAFSLIENNHIYHIHQKNQFSGAEIAGIKFHAAIDTRIIHNRINDVNGYGCWFDWMAQGTRISKNLLYNNTWMDLFFEVNHGPFLVDNNILLSDVSIGTMSEGGSFVHNLIYGKVDLSIDPWRFTPYHLPHSTELAGFSGISSGDDRYYNNIFLAKNQPGGKTFGPDPQYGLSSYKIAKLPIWVNGNVYYGGALH